jgi:hypothetical protein
MTIESTHKVIYTITPEYGGAYGWIIRNGDESQGLGPNHASSLFGWGGDHPISDGLQRNLKIGNYCLKETFRYGLRLTRILTGKHFMKEV